MMRTTALSIALICGAGLAAQAEVSMDKVSYGGWENCVRLSNGAVELVVTTDVGPRVIRFGFVDGQNVFKEYAEQLGQTGGDEWLIYGGHRLWHAPEAKPRTYWADNVPVEYEWDGKALRLFQPVEESTGIRKEMDIVLDPDGPHVTVQHRLINENAWAVDLASWALTVMAPGGRAIFPQEPYRAHSDYLLPARPCVLWHYTDMQDPRWTWGTKYIQLRQDPEATSPQKVGLMNKPGWAAYTLNGDVFIKRFPCDVDGVYPDFGCNFESFTNADMLEVESLGAMTTLPPDGGTVGHMEDWYLFKAEVGQDEAAIDKALQPLLKQAPTTVAVSD